MQATTGKLLVRRVALDLLVLSSVVRGTSAFACAHDPFLRRRYTSSVLRPASFTRARTPSSFCTARMSSTNNTSMDNKDEECDIEAPPGFCSKFDDLGSPAFETEASSTGADTDTTTQSATTTSNPCIRLQANPDICLRDISTESDAEEIIRQVREQMGECRRSDLYERQWTPIDKGAANRTDTAGTAHTINVLQFNTLAEGLSSAATESLPFGTSKERGKDEKTDYGGFTEVPEPAKCLDYALRRWRIIEVITGACYRENQYAAATRCEFDLVALEEVDRFAGFFEPTLALFGYRGIFSAKPRAPGIDLGWYSDGCALFWRTETFDLVDKRRGSYNVGTQVYLLATLKHKESGRVVVVAVTHLKASKSKENERIRTQQAMELVDVLAAKASEVATSIGLSERDIPIIIMGDFNSEPTGEGYTRTAVKSVIERHHSSSPRLASAYPLDLPFSTWKTRGKDSVKRVIDYIFHNDKDARAFECTDILGLPDEKDMESHGLPGFRYPSDHLALAARFRVGN
mmetsp:Transcript_35142/g.76938  ORF Transcript_35142/g.76938 Transcript_35142/m.76938 type:complete len:518 (+) Transcript_35142:187-1740(+)